MFRLCSSEPMRSRSSSTCWIEPGRCSAHPPWSPGWTRPIDGRRQGCRDDGSRLRCNESLSMSGDGHAGNRDRGRGQGKSHRSGGGPAVPYRPGQGGRGAAGRLARGARTCRAATHWPWREAGGPGHHRRYPRQWRAGGGVRSAVRTGRDRGGWLSAARAGQRVAACCIGALGAAG